MLKKIGLLASALVFATSAQAGLITETFEITVSDPNASGYWNVNAGDSFTIDISYDAQGTRVTNDGTTECTASDGDFASCDVFNPTFDVLSGLTFDVSAFTDLVNFNAIEADGYTLALEPVSSLFGQLVRDFVSVESTWNVFAADIGGIEFFADEQIDIVNGFEPSAFRSGWLGLNLTPEFGVASLNQFASTSDYLNIGWQRVDSVAVSEPLTAGIFALGLVGLMGARRKAK